MLTVHHLDNSRSQRILWLLEEMGVDYEIKHYQRDSETKLAPPDLRDLHPLGKAPIVTDGDTVLAESGAIIEYLVDKYDDGTLRPSPESAEFQTYRYWMHYPEGSLMPFLLLSLIVNRIENAPLPFFAKPIAKGIAGKVRENFLDQNLQRHFGFLESTLSKSTWLCGDELRAADMQMSYPLEAAEVRTNLKEDFPNIAKYLERVRGRPAYQRALEKGGPFDLHGFGKK